jgi:type IV pilus assembly protein PilM
MAILNVVGLDIGTYQIKAVELHSSAKEGLIITNIAYAPTPPGVIENGIITDHKLLGQSIKHMLKSAGFKANKVIGNIAGQMSTVVRIIEVPKMSAQELAETMKWEVERHVPFSPTDIQMDYAALPSYDPEGTNPNMAVLLAAAQKEMIDNYVDAVMVAGLDPIALDIEPLAEGRALLDVKDGHPLVRQNPDVADFLGVQDEGTIAIVNIGSIASDISIFENGQLIFPRSISLAGESFTRQIVESLGYTFEQAEQIKREEAGVLMERVELYANMAYEAAAEEEKRKLESFKISSIPTGTTGPLGDDNATEELFREESVYERTQPIPRKTIDLARRESKTDSASQESAEDGLREQVFDAVLPVLNELSTELKRSLDYYRSRSQGRSVDKIVLCGGGAQLPNLSEFLSRELQAPVEVANPFENLKVTAKLYDQASLSEIGSVFAVAVGLAVREAVFTANPSAEKKSPKPEKPKSGKSAFSLPSFGGKKEKTNANPGETTQPPL